MSNIRVVISAGDGEGTAVCLCGRDFDWSIPKRINVLYKVDEKQQLYNVICCPRCLSMLKN